MRVPSGSSSFPALAISVLTYSVASFGAASPAAAQVDPAYSYYVPLAGTVTMFTGSNATRYFRACPNNDGGSSLPASARIKIHLANGSGGIAGLTPYIKFNGGLTTQDVAFAGNGADSIIANSEFNPGCPDVREIDADAATDANGDTELTFIGPGGVRDPLRKWGHYDCEIPVYVMSGGSEVQILGFLLEPTVAGPYTAVTDPACGVDSYGYVLRIKSMDWTGGLGTIQNQGELISLSDLNGIANAIGAPPNAVTYWKDLDDSGTINVTDFNILVQHFGHNCGTPNSP